MLKEKNVHPQYYQAASTISAIMKIEHAVTLLETQGLSALKEYLDRLEDEHNNKGSKASAKIAKNETLQKAKYIVEGLNLADVEHPKIKRLEELILQELHNNPEGKIIVFNHYRDSVQNLENVLGQNPLISAKRFVGQATKGNDVGLKQSEQKQIIDEFRQGRYNVLIASSVAEEGLDIPQVDTIIFYEPVPSDIRSIQRRGRTGRFKEGKVYVLITTGTRDEAFYWASQGKEKTMMKAIHSLAHKETLTEKIKKLHSNKTNELNEEEKADFAKKLVKQKLITEVVLNDEDKKKDKVVIFVDNRERNSSTLAELKKLEIEIIEKQLEIGDYQVGEEAIIERKTASDFIASIIDGRLFSQAIKMSVYEKPLLLIEGDLNAMLEERQIKKGQVLGAIFSFMFDYKIPVLMALDQYECSEIIYNLAKREQLRGSKPVSLRKLKRGMEDELLQQYVVEGLPHVGPTLALRLLEKFGSVKKVFNAEKERLEKIEGIGEKKAEDIYNVLNKDYINKEKKE